MVNIARNSGLLKLGTKNKTKRIHGSPEWLVVLSVGIFVKQVERLQLSVVPQSVGITKMKQSWTTTTMVVSQGKYTIRLTNKGMCIGRIERISSKQNRSQFRR